MPRDALVLELLQTQYGLVSRAQALRAGLSRGSIDARVRRGHWEAVGHGVYRVVGATPSWHQRALAACLQAEPNGVVSHQAAAWLWKLGGVSRLEPNPIDVTIGRANELSAPGIRARRTRSPEEAEPVRREGILVTSLARTVLDVATFLEESKLELALDSALRYGPAARKAITEGIAWGAKKCRPRIALLRKLMSERDGALDSDLESLVSKLLWATGLPKPKHNFETWHQKRWIARVDFAWPAIKLCLQAHGLKYHLDPVRFRIDQRQISQLAVAGWLPIITTWEEVVKRPTELMRRVEEGYRRASERALTEGGRVQPPIGG